MHKINIFHTAHPFHAMIDMPYFVNNISEQLFCLEVMKPDIRVDT